jgi:glutamine amidotransferase
MNVIIDYGIGNIGSIANMLKRIGAESIISAQKQDILAADKIILCGVGGFDDGMSRLEALDICGVLREAVLEKNIPILGICLGMQLFTEGSEEGNKSGLGLIKGFTRKFNFEGCTPGDTLKTPHMGWNEVAFSKPSSMLKDMPGASRFYFVHSYHVVLDQEEDELMAAKYGIQFSAAFARDNCVGVQFHPEKSHKYGLQLFQNFLSL